MSGALRVLIADDEATARRRLTRLAGAIDGVEVVGEVTDGEALLARVERADVDLVLLDIRMPGLDGLDAAGLLAGAARPRIVFVTAHEEHALRAFDLGAADYVLKPVEAERLARAVDRARRVLAWEAPGSTAKLALTTTAGVELVDAADVRCAVWDGHLTTVHVEGRAILSDSSLAELESRLPPDRFVRVHRRALLNLDHVARLEPLDSGGYRAHTRDGLEVPVGRKAARELRRRLGITGR